MPNATELNVTQTSDATLIADTIFGDGVTIVSSSLTGTSVQSGIYSGATATMGDATPSDTGVIFSTGNTGDITNSSGTTDTNTAANTGTDLTSAGDADLTALGGNATEDAVVFEATFIPTGDYLTMQFVFSSEEYLEYVNSGVNDVFGVWVNDTFVPLTPSGSTASIDTINQGSNENLYVDNPAADDTYNTEMDGLTVTLSMKAPVTAGAENTIKIGLADGGDGIYDTNVMIGADSVQVVALAMSDEVTLGTNSSKTFDILGNDIDQAGGGLTVVEINGQDVVAGESVVLGTGETVTLNADGTVTVDSDGDVTSSSLTYKVVDVDGVSDVGYITINTVATPAPDGIVQGSAAGDTIDAAYTGDPDGDLIDSNDALGVGGTTGDGDYITAFGGDDSILAGAGDDIVFAGADNDTVQAGAGNDTVYLEDGDDTFGDWSTDDGADTVFGGAGNDTINSGNDNDTVYGGADNDTLIGASGDDTLFGGTGSDQFLITDDHESDVIEGGEDGDGSDVDIINFSNFESDQGVTVTATGDETGTYAFNDTVGDGSYSEIEGFISNEGDDTFNLGADNSGVLVDTFTGNDTITTGSGDDTIDGGQGEDVFNTGAGNDQVNLGEDSPGVSDGDADVIILQDGFGDDTITNFDAPTDNGDGTFTGIDTLEVSALTDGTDPVNVNDVTVSDDGSGNAVLTFPNGESITLDGIDPVDADNPFYLNAIGIPLSDGTVSGTAGADTIDAGYIGDPDGDMVDADDAILAGDVIDDDLIEGNGGNDSISAGAGDDEVYGGDGADTINGGDDNDTLYGGNTDEVADLIVNGSFEDLTGTTAQTFGALGAGAITGWTDYNGSNLDLHSNGKGGTFATDGDYVMDMGGTPDNVHMYQDVAGVVDGEIYKLTLDAGDVTGGGNSVEVYWGGELIATIDPVEGGMESFSFDLIGGAGDGGDRLEFKEIGPEDVDGVQLDNIQLTGVNGNAAAQDTSNDHIYGGDGTDTIYGLEGDDIAQGGSGNDTVYGGDGNDTLGGNSGVDTLYGGAGNDLIMSGSGDDLVYGGDGDDNVAASIGSDEVYGGAGNDTISAGGFAGAGDTMYGGADDDTLTGGLGDDTMFGGTGDDTFNVYSGAGTDTIEGGEDGDGLDVDTLNFTDATGPEGVDINMTGDEAGSYAFPTDGGTGTFSEIEEFALTDQNDDFDGVAATGGNTVDGAGGDDVLIGSSGSDSFIGGTGNDTLNANAGDDTLDGGAGDDEIYGDEGQDVITGGADNDSLYGGQDNDDLYGGDGDDIVEGGDGDDTLYGGDGADTLTGGADQDVIYGGAGDVVNGSESGVDNDTLIVSGVDYIDYDDANSENGIVYFEGGGSLTFSNIENVVVSDRDGTVSGTSGDDTINAGYTGDPDGDMVDNNDAIIAGQSGDDDLIEAGAGNDSVFAGDGDDIVYGDTGGTTGTLDWSDVTVAAGDASTTVTAGSESVDITITGDGVVRDAIYSSGDYYAPTTGQTAVPVSTLVEFDTPVANTSFELFDVDSNGTSFDDQYTIIALDADGNQVPVTFSGLTHHVVDGNTVEGQSDLDSGGSGSQDAVTVTIPDGVVSIEIIYEPGSEVGNTGLSGIGDLTFDIIPTAADDALFGGVGDDLIFGGGDNDTINGGAGDDIINGGTGDDVLSGGDDNDTFVLETGFGSDTITGGEGGTDNDEITSLQNVDITVTTTGDEAGTISDGTSTATFSEIEAIETEGGNDTIDLSGDSSGMTADAGAGNDTITGGSGNDSLIGGSGNDDITGGAGDDTMSGGTGSDTFVLDEGFGTDTISAGEDTVTADVDLIDAGAMTSDVTLTFTGDEEGTLSDGTNTATFSDVELVTLGSGNDTVVGGSGDEVVFTGAGDDEITGGLGSDTFYGGAGDDTITFSEGDEIYGGSGEDIFTLEELGETTTGTITIDGGAGDEPSGGDTLALGSLGVLTQDVIDTFVDDGTGSFSGSVTLDDGTILNFSEIENIICFTPRTRIATPNGLVAIEDLSVGDMVVTRDHGLQPIRWIEGRTVPAVDRFAPVRIRKNVLAGQDRDLIVSPQHRVLFQGYRAELLFGESEVLVSAKHLVDGMDVTQDEADMVTYVHMLFDQHEVIYAEGAATESFHPGDIGFSAVSDQAREELFAIFPELRSDPRCYGNTARRCLKSHEAQLIRL